MKAKRSTVILVLFLVMGVILFIILPSFIGTKASMKLWQQKKEEASEKALTAGNFNQIEGSEYLVYSSDTNVVYYMFKAKESAPKVGFGYSYFAPYISENGNFCKYVDGHIVEINEYSED